ncbi:Glycerophosphoryl diester phosphodiesterase [Marinomonas aquimarina]|uniref:Glycerophosphoryl diester phosphodiesterase n=1 Tax=Marinomonas aquimarina TaxID=295068 RepID=A0A1A8TAS3_9GAMM|nr:glycerophosphodiester phosphodiesterase family protein [Marinomonas aquimarina]SBS29688.1 Glycerophosphoryl diester phosphodiesterase [Marinomonas aquimarina]
MLKLSKVIGHRGAATLAPENTLASIRAAAAAGAKWVEIDVYPIAQGGLIIFHDDRLERCTNGFGSTMEASLETILSLDAGHWFGHEHQGEKIPTFEQAIDCLQELGLGLNLEIKYDGRNVEAVVPAILATLAERWQDPDKLLLSSFNYPALQLCRRLSPTVHLGYLVEEVPHDWLLKLAAINACCLGCHYQPLTEHQARAVKAAGYLLVCYTANEAHLVREHWRWGMDSVVTDDPRQFVHLEHKH